MEEFRSDSSRGPTSFGRKAIRRGLALLPPRCCWQRRFPYAGYSRSRRARAERDDADRDFNSACTWLTLHADHPGPILTRHPGEVYLATGRQALEVSTSETPGEIDASSEPLTQPSAASVLPTC